MAKAGMQQVAVADSIIVHCNSREGNAKLGYPTNYIRTTKYTFLSFLPMNMFEQFRKISNDFFLLNMVIALIPGVSPVFPATTIMPLVVVVGVAAVRDAYEDYQRFQSDQRANALPVKMIDAFGQQKSIESKDVQVGDVLLLERGSEIPADALLLSSALADGACFVETANLDGETNLKPKQCKLPLHKAYKSHDSIKNFSGVISCDSPNNSLHKWQGKISSPNLTDMSIDMDNFLLRGCIVRNVDWVMAIVVYTGVNTKLFLNLTQKPPKISRLDTKLNRLILMILVVQQTMLVVIALLGVAWRHTAAAKGFYVRYFIDQVNDGGSWGYSYLTYFVLLSLMMPISLFVSLEFCKTAQAKLMEWDDEMTNKKDRMRARTSSLNEELSQVQYIFSDKTGTLTDNEMRFAKAFAGNQDFDEIASSGSMKRYVAAKERVPETKQSADEVRNFLRLLSLCNTVVINTTPDGQLSYDGSSTDEVALVSTATKNGYRLLARTSDSMTVDMMQITSQIEVITVLPFTPERKMMSVVLREKNGMVRMYTKGADSSVMKGVVRTPDKEAQIINAQKFLDRCAEDGLRTLACGERIFEAKEFLEWKKIWDAAYLDITPNRSNLVHEAALLGESKLQFVGCTAIEDRLQDEVPETIHFLLRCGIVIWVLTGDKRETAVNIAGTSRLLDPRRDLIVQIDLATGVSAKQQLEDAMASVKAARDSGQRASFIVDGKSLETILLPDTFEMFRTLGQMVNSAVCCRVTPIQTASVVAMFQELGNTCLGVGDGANDVSMIQEARVGVGILGLEGSQAERAADYAIPRFRHLRRLLAVHGRYSLIRNSHLIQYSFYKNIVYSLTHVYYSFYNAFSGQPIYDSWNIVFFNIAFTFFPPLVMGILDYDIRDQYLMRYPGLYAELRSPFAVRMSRASSFVWIVLAVFHSWVIYYGVYKGVIVDGRMSNGQDEGMWSVGTTMMNVLLAVVTAQAAISFLSWTWIHVVSLILSFLSYTVWIFVYSSIPPSVGLGAYYSVPAVTYGTAMCWINVLLWVLAIFAPQMAVMVIRRTFFGIDMHLARAGDHRSRKSLPWESVQTAMTPTIQQQHIQSGGGGGSFSNNKEQPLLHEDL